MKAADFLKYVLPHVPGCPSVTARQAVLDAAREFLSESQVWDEIQDPIPVADDVQEYDLEAPVGALCIDVREIYLRTGTLIPVTVAQLSSVLPDWQTAQGSQPRFYTRSFDFSSIRIFPKPLEPAGQTMRVHGVYTLSEAATDIPDAIVARYREPIASGAKYRLMVLPGQTWTDLRLAEHHKNKFDDAVMTARITAQHGKTAGSAAVRPRAFGR